MEEIVSEVHQRFPLQTYSTYLRWQHFSCRSWKTSYVFATVAACLNTWNLQNICQMRGFITPTIFLPKMQLKTVLFTGGSRYVQIDFRFIESQSRRAGTALVEL